MELRGFHPTKEKNSRANKSDHVQDVHVALDESVINYGNQNYLLVSPYYVY